jgi:hypothetical protein
VLAIEFSALSHDADHRGVSNGVSLEEAKAGRGGAAGPRVKGETDATRRVKETRVNEAKRRVKRAWDSRRTNNL